MKKYVVFILSIVFMACTSIKGKDTSVYHFSELENLKLISGEEKIVLTWDLPNDNEIIGVEVLYRQEKKRKEYKIEKLGIEKNRVEIRTIPFVAYEFKVRTIKKDGTGSRGVERRGFSRIKNLVLDKYNETDLHILLPASYSKSQSKYPVVYMLDGTNMFSPYAAVNEEWMIDETMTRLVKNQKVEELIVVGVDDRFPDIRGLVDYIDSKYRTKAKREYRAIMGSSGGASSSVVMTILNSDILSMAGAISLPQFRGLYQFLEEQPKKDIKIWIDGGTEENQRGFYPDGLRNTVKILTEKGYVLGEDLLYFEAEGKDHNERAWSERVEYPYIYFAGDKKNEIDDIEIKSYILGSYSKYIQINPILKYKNGLRYSLYEMAEYVVVGESRAKITKEGKLYFNGELEVELEVKYKKIKKRLKLKKEDFEKELKKGKNIYISVKFRGGKHSRNIKVKNAELIDIKGIDYISLRGTRKILEKLKDGKEEILSKIENYKGEYIYRDEEIYYPLIFVGDIFPEAVVYHEEAMNWYILKKDDFKEKYINEYCSEWWYGMKPAPILSKELKKFNYRYIVNKLKEHGKELELDQYIIKSLTLKDNSIDYYKSLNKFLETYNSFIISYGSHFIDIEEIFSLVYEENGVYRLKTDDSEILELDGIKFDKKNYMKIKEIFRDKNRENNILDWKHEKGESLKMKLEKNGKIRYLDFNIESIRKSIDKSCTLIPLPDRGVLLLKD